MFREIVAEASQLILTRKSRFLEILKDRDMGLCEKIIALAKEAIGRMQEVLRNLATPDDGVSAHIEKHLDELVDYFDEMMADTLDKAGRTTVKDGVVQNQNRRITEGMSDAERAEILKQKNIVIPIYKGQADTVIAQEKDLESGKIGLVKEAIVRVGEEFGVFTDYSIKDVNVEITLSRRNLRESVSKHATAEQIAKLLPILRATIENAVGIEIHKNRYYYDNYTVSFENLLGGYEDGSYFVPIRFGLKHGINGETTLYVVVDQTKIETKVLKPSRPQKVGASDSRLVSTYSIAQIAPFVKSKDLLRYLPDDMLSSQQKEEKWEAISETIQYTNDKNDRKYADFIKKGNVRAARDMVEAAAKANGYYIAAYHGTNNQEEHRSWNAERRSWESTYSPITVFKRQYEGQAGHFFSADKDNAGGYGSTVYSVFLMIKKPLVIECNGQGYDSISFDGKVMDTYEWAEYARKHHYDGVIFKNVRDGVDWGDLSEPTTVYVVFDSNRIKSADTITYDKDGKIIPISKRFNVMQRDIRFQHRRVGEEDRQVLARAAKSLARSDADNEIVKAYFGKLEEYRAKQKELDGISDKLEADNWGEVKLEGSERYALLQRQDALRRELEAADASLLEMEAMAPLRNLVESERQKAASAATEVATVKQTAKLREEKKQARELRVKYLARAERAISRIYKWATHPTKQAHVPTALMPLVQQLFEAVDVSHHFAQIEKLEIQRTEVNVRIGELERSGASHATIEAQKALRNELTKRIKKLEGTQHNLNWQNRLNNLREVMSTVENVPDFNVEFCEKMKEDIADRIAELTAEGQTNHLYDASPELLRVYAEALESISHTIAEAGRLYGNERAANVATLGEQTIQEFQHERRDDEKSALTARLRRTFDIDALNPAFFAHKLGHSTEAVMKEIFDGYYQTIANIRVVDDFLEGIREKYHVSQWTGKAEKLHTVRLEKGGSVTLTTGQIMTLYALSDRPQAKKHLYGRGIQVFSGDINEAAKRAQDWREKLGDEAKRLLGKPGSDLSAFAQALFGSSDVKAVTEADVKAICSQLTGEQVACAKEMKKFLHDVIAPMGNKTSQTLYLYDMFTEENYFPIESVSTFLRMTGKDPNEKGIAARSVFSLLNKGFTKNLQEQAGNPIVIRDVFDVVTEHCFDMANYGGLGVAVSDTIRWLNYKQVVETGQAPTTEQATVLPKEQVDIREKAGYNEEALTDDEMGAVLSYKSGQSYMLNALLRENPNIDELPERFREVVDNLDAALRKLPAYEGVTYRNIVFDDNGGKEEFDLFVQKHAEGQLVYYSAYTSTSTDVDGYPVEGDFVVHMQIHGTNGRNLDGFGNNMESEVLFQRESVFFVQKVEYDENGIPTIHMQEVNENGTGQLRSDQRGATMRDMQALDTDEYGVQGVSQRKAEGDHQRALGSQGTLPRGPRDSVRAEGSELRGGSTLREKQGEISSNEGTTVRQAMAQAWGVGAEAYIKNLLRSIEGELKGTDGARLINKAVLFGI